MSLPISEDSGESLKCEAGMTRSPVVSLEEGDGRAASGDCVGPLMVCIASGDGHQNTVKI